MSASTSRPAEGDASPKPFSLRRDALHLSLVLPQIWLYVMLRALDGMGGTATPLAFYVTEALTFVVVFALLRHAAPQDGRVGAVRAATWPCALAAAAAPALAHFAGTSVPATGILAQVAGGVGLAWSYLAYFQACAGLPARRAVWCLLVSFAAVPVLRLPLDLLPLAPACLVVALFPLLFAALVWRAPHAEGGVAPAPTAGEPGVRGASGVLPLLAQAVAFGVAMGVFRLDAGGAQNTPAFVFAALVAKVAFPLLVLLALETLWDRVSMGTVCQAAVALITVALVAAMNLPQLPVVTFGVFDFARYAMVVLVFLAATSLARRHRDVHPLAVLSAAMGTYVAALAAGLDVARVTGLSGALSGTVALDVVCVLMVVTLVAGNAGSDADARLFSDGRAENAPIQPANVIDARCDEAAARYHLAPREVETMKLICRGRSKKYIAEQLSLSENTVRGYAKTLYAKLDIHSRQEMLTLLGIE